MVTRMFSVKKAIAGSGSQTILKVMNLTRTELFPAPNLSMVTHSFLSFIPFQVLIIVYEHATTEMAQQLLSEQFAVTRNPSYTIFCIKMDAINHKKHNSISINGTTVIISILPGAYVANKIEKFYLLHKSISFYAHHLLIVSGKPFNASEILSQLYRQNALNVNLLSMDKPEQIYYTQNARQVISLNRISEITASREVNVFKQITLGKLHEKCDGSYIKSVYVYIDPPNIIYSWQIAHPYAKRLSIAGKDANMAILAAERFIMSGIIKVPKVLALLLPRNDFFGAKYIELSEKVYETYESVSREVVFTNNNSV